MSPFAADFDFYSITARVECASDGPLDDFRRDFRWFLIESPPPATPRVLLELRPESPPSPSDGSFRIRDDGAVRTVDHGASARVVHDFRSERGVVYAPDPDRLHELGYILLLSRVGEFLDRRGLHRAHGLGFEKDGRGVLALLPIGGGKTTWALELLKRGSVRLLSEDTPLVDRAGRLWPFPVRFGVVSDRLLPGVPESMQRVFRRRVHGTKVLIDVDFAEGAWSEKAAVPPGAILIGAGAFVEGAGRLKPVSRWRALPALVINLLIGVGVPQGKEYLLRAEPAALARLVRTAFLRLRALTALLFRCRVYRVTLGTDLSSNADLVRGL